MSSRSDDEDAINSWPCCSQCHERGHKKNKCSGAKCLTSILCGRMRLHKDEMKTIDTSKSDLKKLLKEKSTLEVECECIRECVRTNNRSFPQAVRSHLINSNKCKYLTMYGDNVVPLTKVIILDLSILQKFYENGSLLIWMRNPNDLNPSFILIHPSSNRVTLLLTPKLLIMLGRLTAEFDQTI